MLGEMIGELRGKRTSRRVLPCEGAGLKVEVSFEGTGKMLGVDVNEIGTYWAATRPDGTLYGEGQGVVISHAGDMATWVGGGVGQFREGGAVGYRGAIYYQTTSPKLARLNSVAVVFEFEVDAQGNTRSQLWEWK